MKAIRYLWTSPVTAVGLMLAAGSVMSGGRIHFRRGALEVHGGLAAWLLRGGRFHRGGAAMTLGHVILARDAHCLEVSREHERHHVRQFERWGPLLLPLYWGIAVWLRMRGRDPYLDHPLEPPPRT